ncbi:unnamed protein product [Dibothriocephalus latus]|uniref:Uncharacterized protein n=1 Tax=Dibothriocephalus latus TaxID=60516 RepID=A0A3P7NMZ6_DIBLA|nr:unnamed protein product [Dibothriocephalus latus]
MPHCVALGDAQFAAHLACRRGGGWWQHAVVLRQTKVGLEGKMFSLQLIQSQAAAV